MSETNTPMSEARASAEASEDPRPQRTAEEAARVRQTEAAEKREWNEHARFDNDDHEPPSPGLHSGRAARAENPDIVATARGHASYAGAAEQIAAARREVARRAELTAPPQIRNRGIER
jgi:hypothetical protein